MGNNIILSSCKLTFVQASCFINGICDNNSIIVFLQTCATREYAVIKMLELTECFSYDSTLSKSGCLPFISSHLQIGRRVIFTLQCEIIELRPPAYIAIQFYRVIEHT